MFVFRTPPVIELWRGGVYLRRLDHFKSLTLSGALNEVREPELILSMDESYMVQIGDVVRVKIDSVTFEDYNVHIIVDDVQDTDGGVTLSLEPSCGSILRCAATSGNTVFDDVNVLTTFTTIGTYLTEELGKTMPITLVNPNSFNLGGRLNANGRNMLEVLRTLCGASGNSFRVTNSCGLEIGQFGEDSGLRFGGPGHDHDPTNVRWLKCAVTRDAADIAAALYVEGGGYHKEGSNDSYTLLMGDNTTGGAAQYSIVPPGYVIELIKRNKKDYFRLRLVGAIGCTRAISIGNITPLGEKKTDIYAAQQMLTNIAVKYLEVKSKPAIRVDLVCPWALMGLVAGQKAQIVINDLDGRNVISDSYYITEYEIRFQGDTITTALTLSNRLYDPDDLLSTSNQNLNQKGDKVPATGVGSLSQSIVANATLLLPACGVTGRLVTVDYSGARYTATPTLTVSTALGITATVVSANRTTATICVEATSYPQQIVVSVSGPV